MGGFAAMGGEMAAGGATATGGHAGGSPDAGSGGSDVAKPDAQSSGVEASSGQDGPAAKVSYKTQIAPLLKTNCVSCHGPTNQNSGIRVDTYANLSKNLTDVTDVLVNGAMPMSGALSDADRQMFQDWVDQGALNN
jgi:mono/diheme cytochrome c family protein